jgi:hypothetical protein
MPHLKKPLAKIVTLGLLWAGALRAETENRILYNIEPTREHPRNSEGSFAMLRSGRIALYYTQFYGGDFDGSAARIAEIHSDDKGVTWSQPRVVVDNGDNLNAMSASMLRLNSGKLALFYLVKRNLIDWRPYLRVSGDEGETWSSPKPILGAAPDSGGFELANDRAIETWKGRIILPIALYRTMNAAVDSKSSLNHEGLALWVYSDDDGRNWVESPDWRAIPDPGGLQEPGAVELADGSLLSWFRTRTGSAYASRSPPDGGEPGNALVFSPPEPTELKTPVAPLLIKRLPDSPTLIAIFNDHSGRFPYKRYFDAADSFHMQGGRTPLVAALSNDGGRTWPARKVLEDDPKGAFCYTAMGFVDDYVFLAYAAEDRLSPHLGRLRIRRLNREWLLAP